MEDFLAINKMLNNAKARSIGFYDRARLMLNRLQPL